MVSLTAKDREDFIRQDRERMSRIANGESETSARMHAYDDEAPGEGWAHGGGGGGDYDVKSEDDEGNLYESESEPVSLPESTHTLFFTHPVCSAPFMFALAIVIISIMCLFMAFTDNLGLGLGVIEGLPKGNPLGVPANVEPAVRIAQYLGILIALLMEEEIPTGAYLLRMIPRSTFKKKFPDRSYNRFVLSAMLRILLGYIFLLNVFVILVKASGVLEIFYDVLALQFISELDDIAFSLAKLDVLGKKLRRACTARLFQTEFEKQRISKNLKASIFLKTVYLVNLIIFLAPMIQISRWQVNGYYQCNKIKVDFGDAVWGDALVETDDGGTIERALPFSAFNGIYAKSGTRHGRPVYQERRKFDRKEFDQVTFESIRPAEIRYSQQHEAWVFYHPNILKKKGSKRSSENKLSGEESIDDASWLLRSHVTKEFDLLSVDGDWGIWFGVIERTQLSYSCTECDNEEDCNFNGQCVEQECQCYVEDDTDYLGPHCEVNLKKRCHTIIDEDNSSWSILKYSSAPGMSINTLFKEYDRPVYVKTKDLDTKEGDFEWLLYTGSRWIYTGFNLIEMDMTFDEIRPIIENFHAFWMDALAYDPTGINLISDPTRKGNPVGVDWYVVIDSGDQYGPFGALVPLANHSGMGQFRCAGYYIPPAPVDASTATVVGGPSATAGSIGMNLTDTNDSLPTNANNATNVPP